MFRLFLLLAPTIGGAVALWFLAKDPWMGAFIGGIAGFIVGIALNAFPNLDQGTEEERTDIPMYDP
ncbi:MAG TPA: hypothetical protein DCL54_10415 [Alphaproteobacteria bacterium]|nr:hypothetical protein [Alphaproteobacteria bacterium]